MGETPEQFWERVRDGLRVPPVHEWDTFPFEGDLRARPLDPPVAAEPARYGEDGIDCGRCARPDEAYLWTNEHWRLTALPKPSGLPVVAILEPRAHCDLGDLPDELAAELGPLIVRVERAVRAVGEIGRVHVGRWGDGSAHLHWWFMGRPARLVQLRGSFAAIWDDVLPALPEDVWRDSLATVARAMASGGGVAHVG